MKQIKLKEKNGILDLSQLELGKVYTTEESTYPFTCATNHYIMKVEDLINFKLADGGFAHERIGLLGWDAEECRVKLYAYLKREGGMSWESFIEFSFKGEYDPKQRPKYAQYNQSMNFFPYFHEGMGLEFMSQNVRTIKPGIKRNFSNLPNLAYFLSEGRETQKTNDIEGIKAIFGENREAISYAIASARRFPLSLQNQRLIDFVEKRLGTEQTALASP